MVATVLDTQTQNIFITAENSNEWCWARVRGDQRRSHRSLPGEHRLTRWPEGGVWSQLTLFELREEKRGERTFTQCLHVATSASSFIPRTNSTSVPFY